MPKGASFPGLRIIPPVILTAFILLFSLGGQARAQKDLPEVIIATAVSTLAFAAIWVAEQLKYFEQEGVRAKITVAGGGSPCQAAVVGRSVNFCASSSEGLILARLEGAPLMAVQAHNRTLTLSLVVRKEIAEKFKVTRESPLNDRIKVFTQLKTIGATSPGAVSEQIFKFLVKKVGGNPEKLKFVYLGGTELAPALMNNIIDGFGQSPPGAETTEAAGKGYVLVSLSQGEIPELTDYPYEVLMARPDFVEKNPKLATAVARAISRGGALFHSNPQEARAALRAHRFSNPQRLTDEVFDLSSSLVKEAIPKWGDMSEEGWQKVLNFSIGAGILKDPSKAPSAKEGILWTNKYVGKGP
ncbi:MAG: ABC transporter substrate-binding protein [Deltaproteobacteria bacterium]|nr:ABC transporter substrate-binding protein [Deltaproteobacteria bacterium]